MTYRTYTKYKSKEKERKALFDSLPEPKDPNEGQKTVLVPHPKLANTFIQKVVEQ